MKLLLDTHALLWMVDEDAKLSTNAREALLNASNELHFSLVSYWEIALKISLDRIELGTHWANTLRREMSANDIQWLTLEASDCEALAKLPWHHRDPFDRMLVAQAQTRKLTLVTKDRAINEYQIPILW